MNNLLINKIQQDFPDIFTKEGSANAWLPEERTIIYNRGYAAGGQDIALLHEVAHAILGHMKYGSDIELIIKEASAWAKAKELAAKYEVSFDDDHIEDCLDTYREWLITRSKCPRCQINTFQSSMSTYRCYNCGLSWRVSPERFCRTYRMSKQNHSA